MSFDVAVKPVGSPVTISLTRPAPEAAQTAIQTQLPAPQSVTATSGSAQSNTAANSGGNNEDISRQVIFDQAAAQVVYVSIDQNTDQVISQYPESWQLRARAYFRSQGQSSDGNSPAATDRTV